MGSYEIYLKLVHTGRLRENEGVIERGRVVRGKGMKKKMGSKRNILGLLWLCVSLCAWSFSFSCLQREESCAISFFPQLVISRHVSKHC